MAGCERSSQRVLVVCPAGPCFEPQNLDQAHPCKPARESRDRRRHKCSGSGRCGRVRDSSRRRHGRGIRRLGWSPDHEACDPARMAELAPPSASSWQGCATPLVLWVAVWGTRCPGGVDAAPPPVVFVDLSEGRARQDRGTLSRSEFTHVVCCFADMSASLCLAACHADDCVPVCEPGCAGASVRCGECAGAACMLSQAVRFNVFAPQEGVSEQGSSWLSVDFRAVLINSSVAACVAQPVRQLVAALMYDAGSAVQSTTAS